MATHSSILAWRIPGIEEPGLPSVGSHRVGHDWCDFSSSSTQIIHKKTNILTLRYSTLKSTVVQYSSWHTGVGIEWIGNSYLLEEREEVGDGRPEWSSAIGDGGKAVLMPDTDGMCVCIFESLQLESSCLRGLLYINYICFLYFSTVFIFLNGI